MPILWKLGTRSNSLYHLNFMRKEESLDKILFPCPYLCIYKYINCGLKWSIRRRGNNLVSGRSRQPLISSNLNTTSITHLPSNTLLYNILSSQNTPPSIGRITPHPNMNKVTIRKVSSLENSKH